MELSIESIRAEVEDFGTKAYKMVRVYMDGWMDGWTWMDPS
jgi:hypothetical protein